jgi:GNAT superfamily N-acetyltransferase
MSRAGASTLRLVGAGELAALAALYADCARLLGPQVYTPSQVAAWEAFPDDEAVFRDYILGAATWGLYDDATGALEGFCGIDATGEVRSLYVRPDLTRQGFGTRMLTHALANAREAGQSRFTAWATPFSLPVFDRTGLRLVGTVREPFCGVSFERYRVEGA